MKKYNLNLKNNEELIVDVDDLMEQELATFLEAVKDVEEMDLTLFDNWVSVYKLLNYDIIDNLKIDNVYKFNDMCAVIELTFNKEKEYDFLSFNKTDMTVSCMYMRGQSVRNYIVRRLLIPQTTEEALSFAKSEMSEEAINKLSITINELNTKGEQYKVELNEAILKVQVTEETENKEEKVEETENKEEINECDEENYEEEPKTKFNFIKGFFDARSLVKDLRKENKQLKKELQRKQYAERKAELHILAAKAAGTFNEFK